MNKLKKKTCQALYALKRKIDLANIFLEWFEDTMLKSAPVIQTVWWRYVDGTFVLIDKTSVPQFHAHTSKQEESIIFTKEEEDKE